MKFYSEITEKMYDSINALYKAEEEEKAKKQNDAEEAAKELKSAVEKIAREAAEYEKKIKEKEQEAVQLEKEFINKYGIDAFRTLLLIPALRNSLSDITNALGLKMDSMSNVADAFETRTQRCPSGNDLKDAILKFLDN